MLKIDFSELETAEDGSGNILYRGQPFSGIAHERDDKGGRLIALAGYSWGAPHGPFRSWYTHGQMKSEMFFFKGLRNGPRREWSETGSLSANAYWECDFCIFRQTRGTRGQLTEEFRMTPAHRDWPLLEKRRQRPDWRVIDINIEDMEFVERPHRWQAPDGDEHEHDYDR